jgi:hypothetical protein
MGVKEERLKTNVIAIEEHLKFLINEKNDIEELIEDADDIIRGYATTISSAKGDDKKKYEHDLKVVISNKKDLNDELNDIVNKINSTEERYDEAKIEYAEYLQNGAGIKRKVVKRKVIPAKASRPVKPTVRKPTKRPVKPTKPIARKPTKPTKRPAKPTARKPTIVRRK